MKQNKLAKLWMQNKVAINAWLAIPNAWTAEIIANTGFDACTIDMQHGLADYQMALSMLQSISSTESTPLVRVPWNEQSIIMRMLDAGAYGIIVPMINTKEEVKTFIQACKYPPNGERSYGPIRASITLGENYFEEANNEVLAIIMIETKKGLENIEEIANVDGLNGFYIGTMDLSISLGLKTLGDLRDPILNSAIVKIVETAKEHNLVVGVHSKSTEETELLKNLGINLITPMNDSNLLQSSAKVILDKNRKLL